MLASVANRGKTIDNESKYLLFINTKNGQSNQVNLPSDAGIQKIEQVKIDSLKINLILVSARTVDLDNKKGIDWNNPTQLIIISFDGKEKNNLPTMLFLLVLGLLIILQKLLLLPESILIIVV